ncbi:MAG: hypothetical protein WDO71_02445 [Bacteroidota bacterium]
MDGRDSITKNNIIRVNGPYTQFNGINLSGCTGLTTTFNDLSLTDGVNPITTGTLILEM